MKSLDNVTMDFGAIHSTAMTIFAKFGEARKAKPAGPVVDEFKETEKSPARRKSVQNGRFPVRNGSCAVQIRARSVTC